MKCNIAIVVAVNQTPHKMSGFSGPSLKFVDHLSNRQQMIGSIIHVPFLKLQKISVALRETPLLFLLFGLLVKYL